VSTVWGEAAAAGAATGGAAFDVLIDNNGKDMQGVQPVIDWAKVRTAEELRASTLDSPSLDQCHRLHQRSSTLSTAPTLESKRASPNACGRGGGRAVDGRVAVSVCE
jgi:hypothetical protein